MMEESRTQLVSRLCGYARRCTGRLATAYGIPVTVTLGRAGRSFHRSRPRRPGSGNHKLDHAIDGAYAMTGEYETGFREHRWLQHLLPARRLTGMEAVHQLVLHEFAHVLQTERGGRFPGSVHNAHFVAAYLELMRRFPYGEADHRQAEPLPAYVQGALF